MMFILTMLLILISILVNVAFITLVERKILSYSQTRKGPNKVSLSGVLQPFADAIKLFSKEILILEKMNPVIFFLCPLWSMILVLLAWNSVPFNSSQLDFSFMFFILILSLNLYPLLFSGWVSNSNYAFLGSIRSVAQTISYEVSLALIIMSIISLISSLSVKDLFVLAQAPIMMFSFPLIILWLISSIAESNRTPFDFAEGESELVSGFNIEFGSIGFSLIFMAEYASIILLSAMTALLLKFSADLFFLSVSLILLFCFFWIWTRATFPRYRYDKLMNLSWKGILPLSLSLLSLFISL